MRFVGSREGKEVLSSMVSLHLFGKEVATYAYDAQGRRIRKQLPAAD